MVGLRLFYFLFFVGLGLYSPAFPRWLEAHGISGFELGLVAATSPVMGLVSPPLFGWLADRRGLRRALVGGTTALAGLVALGLGLLAGAGRAGFETTLALVGLLAFFRAPMGSLADTVALETGAAYGRVRLWGSLGFLVAAGAGGRYLEPTSNSLLVAVAMSLAVAALSSALLPSRVGASADVPSRQASSLDVPRELRALVACALALEAAHSAYDLCYSLHLRDHGVDVSTAGVLWALGVLAEVAFFLAGEHLLARFGASKLLVVGTSALALRLVGLPHAHSVPVLVAMQGLHAFTFGATWTALMRIVRERAQPGTLGRLRGLFSVTAAIGGAAGMITWGTCYRAVGGGMTFRCAAVVAVVATMLALASGRRLSAAPATTLAA